MHNQQLKILDYLTDYDLTKIIHNYKNLILNTNNIIESVKYCQNPDILSDILFLKDFNYQKFKDI